MAFSASDAAFEGFRIARERPLAILAWAVVNIVLSAIMSVALISWVGPQLAEIVKMGPHAPGDPSAAMAVLPQIGKLYAVMLPIYLIQFALLTCAVYRAVLRPGDGGLGFLKVSADEFRVLLVGLAFVALWVAGAAGLGVVAALLDLASPAAAAAFAGISTLVFIGVSLWVFVRLSLAPAMTFTEGRLIVFGSWRVTRGRFWSLFGAYLLAFVLALIVLLLGAVIIFAVSFAMGHASMTPDFSSLAGYFTPAVVVTSLLNGVLTALMYAIFYAPGAVIWRALKAETAAGVFE